MSALATTDVRLATRADIPALAEIVWAWEQEVSWKPAGPSAAEIARMFDEAFDARDMYVFGDPAQGYLSFDPQTLKIGGLYVRSRGQGVGKALMDAVKSGRDFIWLHTHVPNVAAQKFYAREGFVDCGVVPCEGDEPDELRMEWRS
ncbi:GNAT family N-acetyltransferase [Celeribacter sp.]|uniref:GNAT family N-acetyltransferase n=1 Tax=Celeribacter sp. TaxID=1890673 RepID=UPI003A95C30A